MLRQPNEDCFIVPGDWIIRVSVPNDMADEAGGGFLSTAVRKDISYCYEPVKVVEVTDHHLVVWHRPICRGDKWFLDIVPLARYQHWVQATRLMIKIVTEKYGEPPTLLDPLVLEQQGEDEQ